MVFNCPFPEFYHFCSVLHWSKIKCLVYISNFLLQGLKWRLLIAALQIMAAAVTSVATGPVAPSALVTMVTRCRLTARRVKVGNENIALVNYAAIYIYIYIYTVKL